jgi:tetratricopeptide (TPR) repeat protein
LFFSKSNAQLTELPKNKSIDYYKTKAQELKESGNYKLALEACNIVISARPNSTWMYDLRGDVYTKLEKYDSAVLNYSQLINSFKDNSAVTFNKRGVAYFFNGSYEAAIQDYNKAIELDTTYTAAFANLANAYFLKGDFESARYQYSIALDKDPKNENFKINLGFLNYKSGSFPDAISNFYSLKVANPKNPFPYYGLILTHIANRNYSDAYAVNLEIGQKALKLNWTDSIYNFILTYVDAVTNYMYRDKPAEALELLKKAKQEYTAFNKNVKGTRLGYFPSIYSDLLATIGWQYEKMDSLSLAQDYYSKAKLLNPYQKTALYLTNLAQLDEKAKVIKIKDITPPEVTLITPKVSRGQGIFADADTLGNVYVSGMAKDPSGISWIKINGTPVQNIQPDGFFDLRLKVKDRITIQAADKNGNTETGKSFEITKVSYKQPDGDIPPIPAEASPRFHALLIAETEYDGKQWNKLPSTTKELTELSNILIDKYNFDPANIDTVFNKGKTEILDRLNSKVESLNENDNLIICFSGHGTFDKKGIELIGYWVPINTSESSNKQLQYISNLDVQQVVAGCRANHILMLSDACYSGAFKSDNSLAEKDDYVKVPYQYEYSMKDRSIITSGGLEKVPGESQFMRLIIKALQDNNQKYLSMYELYSAIAPGVKLMTNNQPVIQAFGKDGQMGGQFFFIKSKSKQ